MFVIGEKEMLANSAALRIQGKGDQGVFSISDLVERIKSEIEERA
jgi:threonyl-tRNA synthetase